MRTLILLSLCALVPAARAQVLPPGSGFDWQRVGDYPIHTRALAFGPDSLGRPDALLWVSSGEGDLLRLDATAAGGASGTWVLVNDRFTDDYILPLSADTLLVAGDDIIRSTDGGVTFEVVAERENSDIVTLAEVPAGTPYAGRLVAGEDSGAPTPDDTRYSDDRGATWATAATPDYGGGEALVVLPVGSAWAGRVVSAARARGVMLSDDGGETYYESGLWAPEYGGDAACLVVGPGGGVRVVVAYSTGGGSGLVWVSDDGGQTWTMTAEVASSGVAGLVSLGGASAVLVGRDGLVYRSDDAGHTWPAVGRAPDVDPFGPYAAEVAVGPDGRLYVGLSQAGPYGAWVYRTEPLTPVSAESNPEPEEEGLGLEVRPNPSGGAVEVAFTLAQPSEVEVAVYDVLGRRVAVLASGRYGAGTHTLAVGAGLPVGVYVVRVEASGAVASRRFTLVR